MSMLVSLCMARKRQTRLRFRPEAPLLLLGKVGGAAGAGYIADRHWAFCNLSSYVFGNGFQGHETYSTTGRI